MKKYLFYVLFLSGFISSCNDVKNVYDEEYVKSLSPFSQYDFADNFDWSMTHDVAITVKVSDTFGSKYWYGVEIFAENPVFNPDARLLAKGVAKEGNNFVTSLSLAKTVDRIFVRQTTPENLVSTMALDINGDTALLDFTGETRATRAAFTRAAETRAESRVIEMPSGEEYYPTSIPEGAVEYNTLDQLSSQKIIKITKNSSDFKLNQYGNSKPNAVYITAQQVTLDGSQDLSGVKIYVMEGAQVTLKSNFQPLKGGALLSVADGAIVTCNSKLTLEDSQSVIVNRGTLQAKSNGNQEQLYLKGSCYNEGTLDFPQIMVESDDSGRLVNSRKVTVQHDFEYKGGGVLNNQSGGTIDVQGDARITGVNCHFYNDGSFKCKNFDYYGKSADNYTSWRLEVENTMTMNSQSHLSVDANGMVKAKELIMDNDISIYLYNEAYLWVENQTTFKSIRSNGCGIIGMGNKYALARLGNLAAENSAVEEWSESDRKQIIKNKIIDGKIFYSYKHSSGTYATGAEVKSAEDSDKMDVVIPSSGTCNDGYNAKPDEAQSSQNRYEVTYSAIYAFEDNYPSYGDYDMNDVVVKLDIKGIGTDNVTQGKQEITKVLVSAQLLANGCLFRNAVYVQLMGFTAKGTDAAVEQENLGMVIKLCDDVAKASGAAYFRVGDDRAKYNAVSLMNEKEFEIEPKDASALVDANVNFFITTKKSPTQFSPIEIHMMGYKWSGNENRGRIYLMPGEVDARKNANSIGNDVTKAYIYQTQNGEVWGYRFPGDYEWEWPNEYYRVDKKYPDFIKWAEAGGKAYTDWYKK